MRHFITILLVAFIVSSCANNPEKLKYEVTAEKVKGDGFASGLNRAVGSIREFKLQSEAYNYLSRTAGEANILMGQRLDDCFINLSPDYCWYIDRPELSNTQAIGDLRFEYLRNDAIEIEEACATFVEPCGNLYNKDVALIKSPGIEFSQKQGKTTENRTRIVLDPFSITIKY